MDGDSHTTGFYLTVKKILGGYESGRNQWRFRLPLGDISKNRPVVREAPGHDEKVPKLMVSKDFGRASGPLHPVNDRAEAVGDSSGEEPEKESGRSRRDQRSDDQHGDPPHPEVQRGR